MMHEATAGALAGLVATVVMSPVMAPPLTRRAPGRAGLQRFPPRRIVRRLESAVLGHPTLPDSAERLLTLASHAGYGCAMGAAYALLRRRHRRGAAPVAGFTFGLGIWAASYAGWVPAFGVREGTIEGPPTSMPFPIAAHAVYGLVLGLVHDRLAYARPMT